MLAILLLLLMHPFLSRCMKNEKIPLIQYSNIALNDTSLSNLKKNYKDKKVVYTEDKINFYNKHTDEVISFPINGNIITYFNNLPSLDLNEIQVPESKYANDVSTALKAFHTILCNHTLSGDREKIIYKFKLFICNMYFHKDPTIQEKAYYDLLTSINKRVNKHEQLLEKDKKSIAYFNTGFIKLTIISELVLGFVPKDSTDKTLCLVLLPTILLGSLVFGNLYNYHLDNETYKAIKIVQKIYNAAKAEQNIQHENSNEVKIDIS